MNADVMAGISLALTTIGAAVLGFTGWVINVLKLVALLSAHSPDLVMAILRGAGVVLFPLGMILGWFVG